MASYNKEQFLATVKACGYAQKKTAEKYADGRDSFTDDDFIAVYRLGTDKAEHEEGQRQMFRVVHDGCNQHKSTKRYKQSEGYGGVGNSVGNIGF